MTQKNRTDLKTYFNTGDTPTEAQFGDTIDSDININEDIVNGTEKPIPVDADKFTLWDSVAGALKTLTLANLKTAIGGGGGTEYQIYQVIGWVDSSNTANWMTRFYSSNNEWNTNTGIVSTAGANTIPSTTLFLALGDGVASADQTVQSLNIQAGNGSANLLKISVLKVVWNTDHTLYTSIETLYENAISFTNNMQTILAASFINTAISKNDNIYILIHSDSGSDRPFSFQLKCSID